MDSPNFKHTSCTRPSSSVLDYPSSYHFNNTSTNEDMNAIAIDSMLVNIRIIFKKIILFRKYLKDVQ